MKILNSNTKKINSKKLTKDYNIYTPDIVKKYKATFKVLLKMTDDRNHTLYIMYGKVKKWYEDEKNLNIVMEKIHIKTKLGSYLSGGCGIEASLLANLTASGIFAYSIKYIKNFTPLALIFYLSGVTLYGVTVLWREDNQVEMYNMFLEVLNELENNI
ncbi:hypothetical protein UT300005_06460 [Clostridium sp. CTA-5]